MTDFAIIKANAKTTLMDIAKQAAALGTGLQMAAPGATTPNNSVQYLLSTSESLVKIAEDCEKL